MPGGCRSEKKKLDRRGNIKIKSVVHGNRTDVKDKIKGVKDLKFADDSGLRDWEKDKATKISREVRKKCLDREMVNLDLDVLNRGANSI